jgi:uncharacterized protein YqfB (UPF0267 family)
MQADIQNGVKPFFCPPPEFATNSSGQDDTAAKAAGRRYEKKALAYLREWARLSRYSPVAGRWLRYRDHAGVWRFCEIDFAALSDLDDNLVLVEIKRNHTRKAFPQLRLYKTILQEIYPQRVISCIELCEFFDSAEFKAPLFDAVRPHDLAFAAVVWTPPRRYEVRLN